MFCFDVGVVLFCLVVWFVRFYSEEGVAIVMPFFHLMKLKTLFYLNYAMLDKNEIHMFNYIIFFYYYKASWMVVPLLTIWSMGRDKASGTWDDN